MKDLFLVKAGTDGSMLTNAVYNCGGSSDAIEDLTISGGRLLAAVDSNRSGKERACLAIFSAGLGLDVLKEYAPCTAMLLL